MITKLKGIPYLAPTIGIEPISENESQIKQFIEMIVNGSIDYVICMTGPGVYLLMTASEKLGNKKKLVEMMNCPSIIARSAKPESQLNKNGIRVTLVPKDNTTPGILNEMRNLEINNKRIAILSHGSSNPDLCIGLEVIGAKVFEFMVYKYGDSLESDGAMVLSEMGYKYLPPDKKIVIQFIHELIDGKIDAVTFTSPPSVRNLFRIAKANSLYDQLKRALNNVIIVAVGPPSRKTIEDHGVSVHVTPQIYKLSLIHI